MESDSTNTDTTASTLRPYPANASVQEEFGWVSEWLRHHQLFTTLDALLDEGMQLLDLDVAKTVAQPVRRGRSGSIVGKLLKLPAINFNIYSTH